MQGGAVQSLGFALTEGLMFDDSGRLTNPSLLDYRKLTAADLPEHRDDHRRGAGAGRSRSAPAASASRRSCRRPPRWPTRSSDAIGVRLTELPMTPGAHRAGPGQRQALSAPPRTGMRSPSAAPIRHDLVLVGGGHAHIQVLTRWAMAPVPGARLTLVVDRPVAVYSGMVPGFVAGQYPRDDLEIDVRPLALRAGARCIVAPATGVDTTARRLVLEGRPPIAYDTVSFDVGSTVAGLDLPGVARARDPHAPHRRLRPPGGRGAGRGTRSRRRACGRGRRGRGRRRGGLRARGAAPCARAPRASRCSCSRPVPRVLPGYAASAAARVQRAAAARGIAIRTGTRVTRVEAGAVHLERGERLPADAVVWVAGAAALAALRRLRARDRRGAASSGSARRSSASGTTRSSRSATARRGPRAPASPRPGCTRSARARCSRTT